MRLINLALVIAALASVAASNTIDQPRAQYATEAISFTSETVTSPTYKDIKAGSTLIEWSGTIMGSLGVMTVIGLEPSAAIKRIIKQVGIGESKQSSIFNTHVKSIVTGLSYGVSLALVSPLEEASSRVKNQRRRLALPTAMLSYAIASLLATPASAVDQFDPTLPGSVREDVSKLFPPRFGKPFLCPSKKQKGRHHCQQVSRCQLLGQMANDHSKLAEDIYLKLKDMGREWNLRIEEVQRYPPSGGNFGFFVVFHHDMAWGDRDWSNNPFEGTGQDGLPYTIKCYGESKAARCCDVTA